MEVVRNIRNARILSGKGVVMKTNARLDECYKKAKVIPFDSKEKYIFFSDVHRGDNSMSDEFAHNQNIYYHALKDYYEKDYTYIELGDGDELWEHPRFEIIMSAHSDVFLLLREFYKKDRFLSLSGNHNIYMGNRLWTKRNIYRFHDDFLDKESALFPDMVAPESYILRYKKTGQEILLVHGHQGDLFNDRLWFISMFSLRFFWRFLHAFGFQNPASPAKNRIKRHKIEVNFSKWINEKGVGIMCGHTHRPKLSKSSEIPYFNSGCCIHPRGINGIEIVDGKIMLIDWRVRPEENGNLKISKRIIRGPIPIEKFKYLDKDN